MQFQFDVCREKVHNSSGEHLLFDQWDDIYSRVQWIDKKLLISHKSAPLHLELVASGVTTLVLTPDTPCSHETWQIPICMAPPAPRGSGGGTCHSPPRSTPARDGVVAGTKHRPIIKCECNKYPPVVRISHPSSLSPSSPPRPATFA